MPVDIPTAEALAGSGIKTFESAAAPFEKAGGEGSSSEATSPLVPVGPGLPALPKKVILKIEGNDYIDFNELPPAKGKGRSVNQSLEGQFIIVQAADLMQSRKTIPDLATWSQCFALFTAVVAKKRPDRVPELMAYMSIITKASQKYKWPSWVIYDQTFVLIPRVMPASHGQRWIHRFMRSVSLVNPSAQKTGAAGVRVWTTRHRGVPSELQNAHGLMHLVQKRTQHHLPFARNTTVTTGTANSESSAATRTSAAGVGRLTQSPNARSQKAPNNLNNSQSYLSWVLLPATECLPMLSEHAD